MDVLAALAAYLDIFQEQHRTDGDECSDEQDDSTERRSEHDSRAHDTVVTVGPLKHEASEHEANDHSNGDPDKQNTHLISCWGCGFG